MELWRGSQYDYPGGSPRMDHYRILATEGGFSVEMFIGWEDDGTEKWADWMVTSKAKEEALSDYFKKEKEKKAKEKAESIH